MTSTHNIEEIANAIIAECQDDFVGLWAIIWEIKRAFQEYDEKQIKDTTIEVLSIVLDSTEVTIGDFDGEKRFVPWEVTHEEALERIVKGWNRLQREPDIGDLAWLAPAGFKIG